jgi:hypothetical protein
MVKSEMVVLTVSEKTDTDRLYPGCCNILLEPCVTIKREKADVM